MISELIKNFFRVSLGGGPNVVVIWSSGALFGGGMDWQFESIRRSFVGVEGKTIRAGLKNLQVFQY
jgi:hypothetical protein